MRIGEKIKRIRKFRKLTQKELSQMVGLDEKGHRIVQYEIGERVPKKELTDKIAEALNVNPHCLYEEADIKSAEDIMFLLFWLEEQNKGMINFISMERFPEKTNAVFDDDHKVYYHDSDCWPAHAPTGLYFEYGLLNELLHDWADKKKELETGVITYDKYFEWKITWPESY